MTDDPFAPLPPASESREPAAIADAPAAMPLPEMIEHRRHGTPSQVWRYDNAEGALLYAVLRFDTPNGKKQVLPFTCGAEEWEYKAPPALRPIYNLPGLAARPDAPVLVVEGEKAADAAAALFPDFVVTTWQGGCNATGKADWSLLRGRRVIVCRHARPFGSSIWATSPSAFPPPPGRSTPSARPSRVRSPAPGERTIGREQYSGSRSRGG
jgi:hypothetical protein